MTASENAANDDLGELTTIREFDAPRELVYRAFVDPAQLAVFWGPTGTSVPLESVVIEPWAGGRFESTIVVDDGSGEFPMAFTFVEVVENERLVIAEPSGVQSTTTFIDLGDGRTRLEVHQINLPSMYRTPEAQAGLSSSFDKLAAHLATLV